MKTINPRSTYLVLRALPICGLLLAALLTQACGGQSASADRVFSDNPVMSPTVAPAPLPTPSSTPTVEATPTPDPDPTATPTPDPTSMATPTATVTPTPTATPTATPVPTPMLTGLQNFTFRPRCGTSCHVGSTSQAVTQTGLRFDTIENTYSGLVGVPATGLAGEIRVIPGDAENSYLIKKLEGRDGIAGSRMPLSGSPLTTLQLNQIRAWINAGAPPATPVAVSSKPGLAEVTSKGFDQYQVDIALAEPVDMATLEQSGAVLFYALIAGQRHLTSVDALSFAQQENRLSLQFSFARTGVDALVLELNNPAFAAVLDQQGALLDGDGDGREGGMLQLEIPLTSGH